MFRCVTLETVATKKSDSNSKRRGRARKPESHAGIKVVRVHGGVARRSRITRGEGTLLTLGLHGESGSSNGTRYEHQRIKNTADPKEREKMLEKRKKLTLEAFRIAYEDHHRRKRS